MGEWKTLSTNIREWKGIRDIHNFPISLAHPSVQAFLRIYGQNGVTVDGTHYMPSNDELSPTTVPLINGSEFLIYKRRFIFEYPPKEQRAKLLATPRPKSRKSLRMSMVNSAQVWSPNPRAKPEENLSVLRSPVKALEDQPPIVMLEGEPVYVQDDGEDLVVVEKVDAVPEPSPKPSTSPRKPQTPSLHRAVLQRNAQRSLQKLNQAEERDVEESIVPQALNFDDRIDEEDEDEEDEEDEDRDGELQEEQKRRSLPVCVPNPYQPSIIDWYLGIPIQCIRFSKESQCSRRYSTFWIRKP